nr:hypothetical protein [Tanacetum cinerariifolium]
DSVSPVASASAGTKGPIPPKIAKQKLARKNKIKAKKTLMLAIPDEHLLKFHACKDSKSLWEEDANLKLLRSLPSAWNNISLIIRNKYDLDTLSMDDLYNNLKVYESEIKGQSSSSLNSQNVAYVTSDNSSNTNETVNTAHSASVTSSKDQTSTTSYADDVMFSFFFNQSNALQLDNEDLKQIDTDDLEEMDLKWQVAMLTMRVKRECKAPRNQGSRNRDAPTRNAPVDTSTTNALVVQDGIGGYDWGFQAEEGLTNFALMAYTSQDKTGLGYDGQMNESDLNDIYVNESEVLNNVFDSRESDGDDNQVNDRFKKAHSPVRRPFNQKSTAKTNNFNEKVDARVDNVTNAGPKAIVSAAKGNRDNGNPQYALQHQWISKSGCSRHMTENKSCLTNYQEIDGGFVTFTGNAKGGKITEKLLDESQVLLKVSRNNNMYNFDLKNVVPVGGPKSLEDEVADDAGKERRERSQRNKFESMFGQDKDANDNNTYRIAAGSFYVNLGGSILVNTATLSNADLPTDPLMPDLEDTADLQDTGIFSGAYDDEVKGAVADFNNLELTIVIMQRDDRILISQNKYVADILKKFDFFLVKTANTPIETNKALIKDEEDVDVDAHLYRSMIGSLMYLTASRIFRYLKGQLKLGLWYPKVSPFNVKAFQIVIMLELVLIGNPQ